MCKLQAGCVPLTQAGQAAKGYDKLRFAKVLIGEAAPVPECELDKRFTELFITSCKAGIPVYGFFVDETGQYMFGDFDVFADVFGARMPIMPFDYDSYLDKHDDTFWLAELNEEPMKSKLLKMQKASS